MKTARELLLEKHRQAQPALSEISRRVSGTGGAGRESSWSVWATVRGWLWPSPIAWGGLAAVWLVVLGLNHSVTDELASPRSVATRNNAPVLASVREQKRLLVELIMPPAEAVPPPRPHTYREKQVRYV